MESVKLTHDEGMSFRTNLLNNGMEMMVDANPEIGGQNTGPRPLELMMTAIGASCSEIFLNVLAAMPISIQDLKVEVEGTRAQDHPRVFTELALTFQLQSDNCSENVCQDAIHRSQNAWNDVFAWCGQSALVRVRVMLNGSEVAG